MYLEARGKRVLGIMPQPFEIIRVPPHLITLSKTPEFPSKWQRFLLSQVECRGIIRDGNWDQLTIAFSASIKSKAINEHFREKLPWKDTAYFGAYQNQATTESKQYQSWEEFEKYYLQRMDRLFRKIEKESLKDQHILGGNHSEEIEISVSRAGTLILSGEGNHRLAIAQLLNLKSIPVVVMYWHAKHFKQLTSRLPKHRLTPGMAMQSILTAEG